MASWVRWGFAGFAMAPGGASSPASGVLSPEGVYSLHNLAQKKRGDLEVLTKAGIRTGRPCREIGGEDRRWRSSELAEKAEAVRPRASGVCGSTREDPVMVQRGVRMAGTSTGTRIKGGGATYRRRRASYARRNGRTATLDLCGGGGVAG